MIHHVLVMIIVGDDRPPYSWISMVGISSLRQHSSVRCARLCQLEGLSSVLVGPLAVDPFQFKGMQIRCLYTANSSSTNTIYRQQTNVSCCCCSPLLLLLLSRTAGPGLMGLSAFRALDGRPACPDSYVTRMLCRFRSLHNRQRRRSYDRFVVVVAFNVCN